LRVYEQENTLKDPYMIDQPMPPILLEPGLRLAGQGITSDGKMWLKFINMSPGRLRSVFVLIVAESFRYHYTIRDKDTGTILAYQGPYGDPSKDTSFIYGTAFPN
jgi:hypothetical protein